MAIHRSCVELRDLRAGKAWRAGVQRLVAELATLSGPHFAEEDATLTADHVATLITATELAAVYRDMGENWHRRP